ncbi:hypothetical protein BS78_05G284800 [Paspalum vaginatum]|nr:hypothetical protein BS78_05G284800 [Paspalum vaginatum]
MAIPCWFDLVIFSKGSADPWQGEGHCAPLSSSPTDSPIDSGDSLKGSADPGEGRWGGGGGGVRAQRKCNSSVGFRVRRPEEAQVRVWGGTYPYGGD